MGSMFRSEEMSLCQLFLQSDAAYACVSELGELGLVQFKDLNPDVNAFQRKYVSEVMRCEEMERKLRYIVNELEKDELNVPDSDENPKAPAPKEMVDLEATFEKIETELREINTNAEALKRNYLELTELREVLLKTQNFFREQDGQHGASHHTIVDHAQSALAPDDFHPGTAIQLGFIAGTVSREKIPVFERMLWFACRGNVFLRYEDIMQPLEDPSSGNTMNKSVFIVFFQGEQLKSRVRKICEGFRASLYPCPETAHDRIEMLNGVSTRLDDLNIVLRQTKDHQHRVLLNSQKEIHNWIIKAKKIKAIFHTLNMCNSDVAHNSLIAECWAPVKVLDQVQAGLQHGQEMSGSNVPNILHRVSTKEVPPTYFVTNKFTKVFQGIVHSYGVATYREVNPAVYTIISFPFLFAVMFGDTGHGFIMFMFGLWMVASEKKLLAKKSDSDIVNMFLGGRYIIMMMGLFSLYTGLIYNDFFSKSVNLFGSSWHPHYSNDDLSRYHQLALKPEDTFNNVTDGPYPMGLDPIWQATTNKITFTNSLKMKLSVILGVSQMLLGVMLSVINHIHFGNYLNVFVQYIPEMLFLLCIFGYLIILIFYKWLTFSAWCPQCAPALLIQFINMFLMKYKEPDDIEVASKCEQFVTPERSNCTSQTTFYANQQSVQITLLVVAVLCIPVLLFVKPFVLRARHIAKVQDADIRKLGLQTRSRDRLVQHAEMPDESAVQDETSEKARASSIEMGDYGKGVQTDEVAVSINGGTEEALIMEDDDDDEKDDFDFGDIFVGQAIHTIEYCLGCVSHTASYLRLWALSLAHAQLSEVLWNMLFRISLTMDISFGGVFLIYVVFAAFAALTIAVLLVMEGLSAFLHTLRLHWVEFQSKFYKGDGYLFSPFTFKDEMNATLEDK